MYIEASEACQSRNDKREGPALRVACLWSGVLVKGHKSYHRPFSGEHGLAGLHDSCGSLGGPRWGGDRRVHTVERDSRQNSWPGKCDGTGLSRQVVGPHATEFSYWAGNKDTWSLIPE